MIIGEVGTRRDECNEDECNEPLKEVGTKLGASSWRPLDLSSSLVLPVFAAPNHGGVETNQARYVVFLTFWFVKRIQSPHFLGTKDWPRAEAPSVGASDPFPCGTSGHDAFAWSMFGAFGICAT